MKINGSLTQYGMRYTFKNSKGKKKTISGAKIKVLQYKGTTLVSLPMKPGGRQLLMRVVAYTDDHILTSYKEYDDLLHCYVFDRNYKILESHLDMHPLSTDRQKKENLDHLENNIAKYFGECEELISAMRSNIEKIEDAHTGISNYACGGADELDLSKLP